MTRPFDEALARFQDLLRQAKWPERISWTSPDQIVVLPTGTTCVYRPERVGELDVARAKFDLARERGVAIELYGVGRLYGVTYAIVRPIEVLADGEEMFLEDNVKVSIPATPTRVVVTRSRLMWRLIETRSRWGTRGIEGHAAEGG